MSAVTAAFAESGHELEESDENSPPPISASGSSCCRSPGRIARRSGAIRRGCDDEVTRAHELPLTSLRLVIWPLAVRPRLDQGSMDGGDFGDVDRIVQRLIANGMIGRTESGRMIVDRAWAFYLVKELMLEGSAAV
jgi:hypothetical protein